MTLRIALIGNCHAQYFGAALSTLPGVEARTVGIAYPGPVAFDGVLPDCLHAKEVPAWLAGAERGLVMHQATPNIRLDLYDRIVAKQHFPLLKFPYATFNARIAAEPTEADFAKDRAQNVAAFELAGQDVAHLDRLEAMVATEPVLFHYNHFTGSGFAVLLQAMIDGGLKDYVPLADLEALRDRMQSDRGISHMIHVVPRSRWPSRLLGLIDDPPALRQAMRTTEFPEVEAHSLWRAIQAKYYDTGKSAYLGLLVTLYRKRRYSNWLEHLVNALMHKNRVGFATTVLVGRIGWEDTRGVLFTRALKMAAEIRRDGYAYATLRNAAAKYPDSTLPLLLQCCDQIRH